MKNRETFKVFQIKLTSDQIDKINAEGHDSVPAHKARLDMQFSDNPQTIAFDAMEKGYYTHVANITTDGGLDGVFEVGNTIEDFHIDSLGLGIKHGRALQLITRMHSISVGDVIEVATPYEQAGDRYVVAEYGFKKVEKILWLEGTLYISYDSGNREVYKIFFNGVDYELFSSRKLRSGRETKPVSEMKAKDVQEIVDFISEELSLFSHMHKFEVEGTGVLAKFNPEKV